VLQDWGSELFEALKSAGGTAYSNYAVGYNNVKVIQTGTITC
jgi:hydroxypyruvate reductase 1